MLQGAVGLRAAHRLRQPGEPDPRARRVAAEGVRDPLGARRRAAGGCCGSSSPRACCSRIVGGALGAALGFAGLRALLAANPDSIPRALEIALDWKVLLFTLGVSIVTGLVFGMAPLLHLREQVVTISLKEGGQRSTAGGARTRVRSGLVMAEVALAVVLVVGAGLLIRSFQKLMTVDRRLQSRAHDDVRRRPAGRRVPEAASIASRSSTA